jgi:hypothetical protein
MAYTITSSAEYQRIAARIRELSDKPERDPASRELHDLIEAVRVWDELGERSAPAEPAGAASAPGSFRTARRPGQPGEQEQRRPGPSPVSRHPAGPHTPYEADDETGGAAIKNRNPDRHG